MMEVYAASLYQIEITVGGMSLLFWDKHRHFMVTPYHQYIKPLIFLANKDAAMQAMFGEVIDRPNI